jgi:hypothetical protein
LTTEVAATRASDREGLVGRRQDEVVEEEDPDDRIAAATRAGR